MQWFSKRQVADNIVMLTEPAVHPIFRANIWYFRGSEMDLVIDTGMGLASLPPVLDLTPGKPVLAVATHAHVDHMGSLYEFTDRAGPKQEAEGFATGADRFTYADAFRSLDEPTSRKPAADWDPGSFFVRPAALTSVLSEGEFVDTGREIFRVLHLPGHSPGSIGLLDERNGVFFSGDAIYDDVIYDQLPDSNVEDYLNTMERLLSLQVNVVHTGHGESFDQTRMRDIARSYIASKDEAKAN